MKSVKKLAAVLTVLALIFSAAACGKKTSGETPKTAEELTELVGKIYEKAAEVSPDGKETYELDLTDADQVSWRLGMDGEGISAAVISSPMINVNPYRMTLLSVKQDADMAKVKQALLDGMNLREAICVAAEKGVVVECGSTVLTVMGSTAEVDDVVKAFTEVMGGKLGEKLEKKE